MAQTIDPDAMISRHQSQSIQVTPSNTNFMTLVPESPSQSQQTGSAYHPLRQNLIPRPRSSVSSYHASVTPAG